MKVATGLVLLVAAVVRVPHADTQITAAALSAIVGDETSAVPPSSECEERRDWRAAGVCFCRQVV
jgi:hypothetical protein